MAKAKDKAQAPVDGPGVMQVEDEPVFQEGCDHADTSKTVIGAGFDEGEPYHLKRCQTCGADSVLPGAPPEETQ